MAAPHPAVGGVDSRDRTVLVVDDVPFVREVAAQSLSGAGRVIMAESAGDALTLARRERPDLIVTDLLMPDQDGADLCRAVRADPELSRTPVIVVSSSDRPGDRARVIRAGASDVLTKPLRRQILCENAVRLMASSPPRGLPRVRFEPRLPVRLRQREETRWAGVENLSRSGAFVATTAPVEPGAEIDLLFRIPDAGGELAPSAEVMWRRPETPAAPGGMGLRFLALDRASAGRLESWVSERVESPPA